MHYRKLKRVLSAVCAAGSGLGKQTDGGRKESKDKE